MPEKKQRYSWKGGDEKNSTAGKPIVRGGDYWNEHIGKSGSETLQRKEKNTHLRGRNQKNKRKHRQKFKGSRDGGEFLDHPFR